MIVVFNYFRLSFSFSVVAWWMTRERNEDEEGEEEEEENTVPLFFRFPV